MDNLDSFAILGTMLVGALGALGLGALGNAIGNLIPAGSLDFEFCIGDTRSSLLLHTGLLISQINLKTELPTGPTGTTFPAAWRTLIISMVRGLNEYDYDRLVVLFVLFTRYSHRELFRNYFGIELL